MNYLVTARKWRPQRFDEIVGQEHITQTLKNAIKSHRLAHAYIFTGSRGVGKTTTARILAKAINCLQPIDYEPCNKCEICNSINEFRSLDIIEIDGASNRGIDDVRNLRESVRYVPTLGKFKVYIIDEVHMLTTESFNAFLKTLEEPPSHTIFIFATTDIHKVPLTIISRCQRFDFRRLQLNVIKEQLKKIATSENIQIDDSALTIIAKKADGAMRDAQSFFDQVIAFCGNKIDTSVVAQILNIIDQDLFFEISDAILENNFIKAFDVVELIHNNGWDFTDFLEGLIEHFRNILSVIVTTKTDLVETAEIYLPKYLNYKNSYSKSDILRILNFLIKSQSELKFSINKKIKLEIILSHLIGLQNSTSLSEIINQLNQGTTENSAEKKNPLNSSQTPKSNEIKLSSFEINDPVVDYSKSETKYTESLSIEENWNIFTNEVFKEKSLTVGPIVKSLKIKNFEKDTFYFYDIEIQAKNILNSNKSYLEKKIKSFFGRQIKFDFSSKLNQTEIKDNTENKGLFNNIEHLIITELGGKKIL